MAPPQKELAGGLGCSRSPKPYNPKGPCTQYLGTWDLGNSYSSIGFG